MREYLAAHIKRLTDVRMGPGSPELRKRLVLSNSFALFGFFIMAFWFIGECIGGTAPGLCASLTATVGFVLVLLSCHLGLHSVSRQLLVLVCNLTVFAGAAVFDSTSGGELSFFPLVSLPLLLFEAHERWAIVVSAILPPLFLVLAEWNVKSGALGLPVLTTPDWYYEGNVLSAFLVTFFITAFIYMRNLKHEGELSREGDEKLRKLVDSSLIGVALGDTQGRIYAGNDAFLRIVGYTRAELSKGIRWSTLTPPEDQDESRRRMESFVVSGSYPPFQKEYVKKDGTRVPVLVGLSLLDREKGEVVGFILDLTDQKRAEVQNRLLKESNDMIRMRDEFNAVASHELRTPLTTMVLQIEFMRKRLGALGVQDELLFKILHNAETANRKLIGLVNSLFDVTRIRSGKLELFLREMDIVEAAENVIMAFEMSGVAGSKQILLRAHSRITGKWDIVRIDQVLTNLISNAIKYGEGKPIEVRIGEERDAGIAIVEIVDHGIGIAPERVDLVFRAFERAVDKSLHIDGLGLGLFIVKAIVEAHGGEISVESHPGKGSTFRVRLPQSVPDKTRADGHPGN